MALLIGNETKEATTLETGAKARPVACKFTPANSGTVEELKATVKNTATKQAFDIGIYDDEAGKPGELKAHKTTGELAASAEGTVAASGFAVKVEVGKTYWLAVDGKAAKYTVFYKKEAAGVEELDKQTVEQVELKKGSEGTWEKIKESAKMTIWGLGAEEGAVLKGNAAGAMLLTGTATGTAAQKVEGKAAGALLLTGTATGAVKAVVTGKATGPLLLTGTSHGQVAGTIFGKATGAALLTGTAKGTARNVVGGKATGLLTLTGTAKGTTQAVVPGKATGALRLTGAAVGVARNVVVGKAGGAITLTGAAKGRASSAVFGSASGVLYLTGNATAVGATHAAARIVIASRPQARILATSRPQAHIALTSRPGAHITIASE